MIVSNLSKEELFGIDLCLLFLTLSAVDGEMNIDMEEDMDLTEDDFRNVTGQFSGEVSVAEVKDTFNVNVETVKVDVSCILILLLMLVVDNVFAS